MQDSFHFWRNLILSLAFFVITPIALGTSLFSLVALGDSDSPEEKILLEDTTSTEKTKSGAKVFASLPSDFPTISGDIEVSDARPEILKQFLADNNSPLASYAQTLVDAADQQSLDWRLLPAIAQKESGLCRIIPPGSHNCWGWGIHSKGSLGFDSYEEAIETVSQGIKDNYIDKGYTTPDEIMVKYTPLSNGSWAEGVNHYMSLLE